MIRALVRLLGFLLLCAGFVASVLDGARFLVTGALTLRPLAAVAESLFPVIWPQLEPAVTRNIHPLLWSHALGPLFDAPAAAVLGLAGLALLWLGRRPPPAIGFSPR